MQQLMDSMLEWVTEYGKMAYYALFLVYVVYWLIKLHTTYKKHWIFTLGNCALLNTCKVISDTL